MIEKSKTEVERKEVRIIDNVCLRNILLRLVVVILVIIWGSTIADAGNKVLSLRGGNTTKSKSLSDDPPDSPLTTMRISAP